MYVRACATLFAEAEAGGTYRVEAEAEGGGEAVRAEQSAHRLHHRHGRHHTLPLYASRAVFDSLQ